ncbi:MAG: ATP-dependent DNA helicase [Gammaproteobacteria bacterium]
MQSFRDLLGPESPLGATLGGFRPRPAQGMMAEAVAEALDAGDPLVVEAGTGIGKTFAYLIPALASDRRTIISTGTRALQDQLYHRDLPTVTRAIGRPVSTALLKGRANYLCLYRLEQVAGTSAAARYGRELADLERWRHETRSGDRREAVAIQEESGVWPLVTSTSENCLGQKCPFFDDCFVVRARRAAQKADVVVVNHHLLLADLALKEEGFVDFLPGVEALILDEAHQIPDLATRFFGISGGSRQAENLLQDLAAASLALGGSGLREAIGEATIAVRNVVAAAPSEPGRYELGAQVGVLHEPLASLRAALGDLVTALADVAGESAEAEALSEQLHDLHARLTAATDSDEEAGLYWFDVSRRSVRFHLTPLDVAPRLRALIDMSAAAWVFTSATLAVGEDFGHFLGRMGLDDARTLQFPSPYRLRERARVYLPRGLPAPAAPGYTEAAMSAAAPLLGMTGGGLFFLFTSYRALGIAADWWRDRAELLADRKLLVQGEAPRGDLLERFRAAGNAVLLGTSTFWEGVDVRGSALTGVVIDKLPFTSPGDPLLMARTEFIRRRGGNPFMEHQLPEAVLSLKQGAGRLIRDHDDYGVVVLCDPRIRSRRYGALFLEALAPMAVTDERDELASFYATFEGTAEAAVS